MRKTGLDGKVAISAGWDRAVRIWDLDTHRERFKLAHTEWIMALAVAVRGGNPVVAAGAGPVVVVWDLTTRSVLAELTGHTGDIRAARVAEMGDTPVLITGSTDSTARLWNLDTLEAVGAPLAGHDRTVYAVDLEVTKGGIIAYTGDADGVVRSWNLTTNEQILLDIPKADRSIMALTHKQLYGRRILAVASSDGTLRLWCLDTATTMALITMSTSIESLAFGSDDALCLGTGMGMVVLEIQDWASA
jgi:WD40 repeat protein